MTAPVETMPTALETVTTSDAVEVAGELVTLPVEVRSAKMVAATFLVDATAAERLVAPTGLRLAVRGGRALCTLSAVQYTDNDLGPYNELAVAFVVAPHDLPADQRPPMGGTSVTTYIHRLPVNQAFTCAAGRGIWGFPKWVADITFVDDGRRTTCVVNDGGRLVCSLTVARSPVPLPMAETEMSCYSRDDEGVVRRTSWTTRSGRMTGRPGGAHVEVGHGDPMADELRSLGLPRRAAFTMGTPVMSATFGPPETITTGP